MYIIKMKYVSVLNQAPRHEDAWRSVVITSCIFNVEVKAGLSRFTLGEKPSNPTGPETGRIPEPVWLEWRRVKSLPYHEMNPGHPARNPVLYQWAILIHIMWKA